MMVDDGLPLCSRPVGPAGSGERGGDRLLDLHGFLDRIGLAVGRWSPAAAVAALLSGAHLMAAAAQPAPVRPDAGTVLQQTREPRSVPLRPAPASPAVVMPGRPGAKTTGIVPVAFRFAGNSRQRSEVLTGAVINFVGKPLDTSNLRDLLNTVEEVYRRAGYAAVVAYLPEQQVRDGVVEIAIVEGRLGRVTVDTSRLSHLRASAVDSVLGTLQAGVPIREADLERRLLLLQDLNGVLAVNSELRPGEFVGEGDLSVTIEDAPSRLRASVDLDNGGSEATGRLRAGTNLRFNNLLGLGDQIGLRLLVQENELTQLGRASYILPVGPHGTKIGFGYTRVSYELGGSFAALNATGEADSYSAFATHPFIRSRNLNVFGQAVLDYKLLSDTVAIQQPPLENDKRVSSGKLGVFGDYRHGNGGLSLGSLLLTRGEVDIRSAQELAADQGGPGTQGRFSRLNYDLQTVQPVADLGGPVSVSMLLLGQLASKNLSSAERLSLGGPGGVRAFPTGQLIVDEGILFQGELRYAPRLDFLKPDRFGVSTVALFYDYGYGNVCHDVVACSQGQVPLPSSNTIHGAGIGLRMSRPGSHLLRVDFAWRTGGDAVVAGESRGSPRIWVQLVKDLM
jgi:hemolysin activation/secretion protein